MREKKCLTLEEHEEMAKVLALITAMAGHAEVSFGKTSRAAKALRRLRDALWSAENELEKEWYKLTPNERFFLYFNHSKWVSELHADERARRIKAALAELADAPENVRTLRVAKDIP